MQASGGGADDAHSLLGDSQPSPPVSISPDALRMFEEMIPDSRPNTTSVYSKKRALKPSKEAILKKLPTQSLFESALKKEDELALYHEHYTEMRQRLEDMDDTIAKLKQMVDCARAAMSAFYEEHRDELSVVDCCEEEEEESYHKE